MEQILVKIVKGAQWQKIRGKQGQWDEFVAKVNRKRGGIHRDPAKHPVDVLAAFVQTFTKKEDVEVSLVRDPVTVFFVLPSFCSGICRTFL